MLFLSLSKLLVTEGILIVAVSEGMLVARSLYVKRTALPVCANQNKKPEAFLWLPDKVVHYESFRALINLQYSMPKVSWPRNMSGN